MQHLRRGTFVPFVRRSSMDPVAFLMVMMVLLLIVIDNPMALLMVLKLQV
jgi:hypothetical protein